MAQRPLHAGVALLAMAAVLAPGSTAPAQEPEGERPSVNLYGETGLIASHWQSLGGVISSPGVFTEVIHLYLATGLMQGHARPEEAEVFEVVRAAQAAGVAAVAAGVPTQDVDRTCRDAIAAAGWGEWFTHGTGHGVGLLIHETPWLSRSVEDVLQVADVVTVEPGVYRGDFGGVRIEDTVVVTTDGCRPLTLTPKDL